MRERKNYQGMMSVSRVNCGEPQPFYGSKVMHDSYIEVRIHEATDDRDYGSDHFMPGKVLAKVQMSPIQWADVITNMASTGIPCTIKKIGDDIMEEPKAEIIDHVNKIKEDANNPDDRVKSRLGEIQKQLKENVDAKKPISVAMAKELLNLVSITNEQYDGDRAFYKKQAMEEIDSMIIEAVNSVESRVSNYIQNLGIEALKVNAQNMIAGPK